MKRNKRERSQRFGVSLEGTSKSTLDKSITEDANLAARDLSTGSKKRPIA